MDYLAVVCAVSGHGLMPAHVGSSAIIFKWSLPYLSVLFMSSPWSRAKKLKVIYIYTYIYIYICCEESLKTPARIGGYAKILGVAGLSEAWSSLDTSGFSSVSGKVSWAKREASGDATFGGRSSYPG